MAPKQRTRIVRDSMGQLRVPATALYGASTQRAIENFPISNRHVPRQLIAAVGLIKRQAAAANCELGLIDRQRSKAISIAAAEVERGRHDAQFLVDVFQTGSGTSTNMNANEVIAARAEKIARGVKIHPNDHVNLGQSSNDVFPSAIHIAAAAGWKNDLRPALLLLQKGLASKAKTFKRIVKTGRTHLQDATPITLGQEFGGYAAQVSNSIERIDRSLKSILELPLGGTAVGTGINTHRRFARMVIGRIAKQTGIKFFEARNHFEAQGAKDGLLDFSASLRGAACMLAKVANDLRWLGSGPNCGLGELILPAVQPGSSIMPGKVNPVIAESVLMVSAQVIGNDAAVVYGCTTGSVFELNVMMPIIALNILDSIALLAAAACNLNKRCVSGIKADERRLKQLADANISIATALVPEIGYDLAAEIAKEAHVTRESVLDVARKRRILPDAKLRKLLDPRNFTGS